MSCSPSKAHTISSLLSICLTDAVCQKKMNFPSRSACLFGASNIKHAITWKWDSDGNQMKESKYFAFTELMFHIKCSIDCAFVYLFRLISGSWFIFIKQICVATFRIHNVTVHGAYVSCNSGLFYNDFLSFIITLFPGIVPHKFLKKSDAI